MALWCWGRCVKWMQPTGKILLLDEMHKITYPINVCIGTGIPRKNLGNYLLTHSGKRCVGLLGGARTLYIMTSSGCHDWVGRDVCGDAVWCAFLWLAWCRVLGDVVEIYAAEKDVAAVAVVVVEKEKNAGMYRGRVYKLIPWVTHDDFSRRIIHCARRHYSLCGWIFFSW